MKGGVQNGSFKYFKKFAYFEKQDSVAVGTCWFSRSFYLKPFFFSKCELTERLLSLFPKETQTVLTFVIIMAWLG